MKDLKNKDIKELTNDECKKLFAVLFDELSFRYGKYKTWEDLIYMWSDMVSVMCDKNQSEERYLEYTKILQYYSDEEKDIIKKMLEVFGQAYEINPEQDFLGEFYMLNRINDHSKGQFFSPYHIAEFMSLVTVNGDEQEMIRKNGYVSCVDTTCGSGVMLLASANSLAKKGVDKQNEILLVGQDLDELTAKMCFIQMAINGLAAIIKIGDALTNPIEPKDIYNPDRSIWRTPNIFTNNWIKKGVCQCV